MEQQRILNARTLGLRYAEAAKLLSENDANDGIERSNTAKFTVELDALNGYRYYFIPANEECKDDWKCDAFRWKSQGTDTMPRYIKRTVSDILTFILINEHVAVLCTNGQCSVALILLLTCLIQSQLEDTFLKPKL
jgi:hypothetical protein